MIIKNICKSYKIKKGKEVKALSDINITFPDSGMVYIVGKSGSGKSTLLNIIGGIDKADDGEIIIDSYSSKDFNETDYTNYRNTYIGFIFQEYNLIEDLDVKSNIALALKLQGKTVSDEEISNILTALDLQGYEKRMPNELSGGERQRVAIARALLKNPKVILADEPTGALDSKTSTLLLDKLKSLAKERLIIIVSHDLENAKKYADRTIELADGKIINDETKENFHESYNNKDFKLIKSKFPTREALKLGFHNLFLHKKRLVFTMIITSFMFILFGLAVSLLMNNKARLILNSMYRDDYYVATIQKVKFHNDGYYRLNNMSEKDIENIKQTYSDYDFIPVYEYYGNYKSYLNKNNSEFHKAEINGIVEINDNSMKEYGFTLLVGRLPTKNEQDNEVVITKYIYLNFLKFGYTKAGNYIEIKSYNDMLDKEFKGFKIVGIIDTNFNEERYKKLYDGNFIELKMSISRNELYGALNYEPHAFIFVRDNYFKDNEIKVYDDTIFVNTLVEGYNELTYVRYISQLKSSENIIWLTNNPKSKLEDNEIIIPSYILPKTIFDKTQTLIREFARNHFEEIRDEFLIDNEYGDNSNHYADYIIYNQTNKYHPGYDYHYFLNIIVNNNLKSLKTVTLNIGDRGINYSNKFTIVGVVRKLLL